MFRGDAHWRPRGKPATVYGFEVQSAVRSMPRVASADRTQQRTWCIGRRPFSECRGTEMPGGWSGTPPADAGATGKFYPTPATGFGGKSRHPARHRAPEPTWVPSFARSARWRGCRAATPDSMPQAGRPLKPPVRPPPPNLPAWCRAAASSASRAGVRQFSRPPARCFRSLQETSAITAVLYAQLTCNYPLKFGNHQKRSSIVFAIRLVSPQTGFWAPIIDPKATVLLRFVLYVNFLGSRDQQDRYAPARPLT